MIDPTSPTDSFEGFEGRISATDLLEDNAYRVASSDDNSDLETVENGPRTSPLPWPDASKLSIITFAYMRPILRKGRRQFKDGHHLTHDDLYAVPDYMKSRHLVKTFR
jgi:hypothetical protein